VFVISFLLGRAMAFGRALLHPGAPAERAPHKAKPRKHGSKDTPKAAFDRATALAVGVLLGLATVWTDRRRAAAEAQVHAKAAAAAQPAHERDKVRGDGWLAIARRTWAEFTEDRIPSVAAGATFYALLALFPALGVFVSLYGLFADVAEAQRQIAGLAGLLPEGGVTVLSEQITRLAAVPHDKLGYTFALSLVLSVWSANAGTKGLIAGLNIAYEVVEKRNFLVLNLVSLAFTAGGIVVSVAGLATVVAVPELLDRIGLGHLSGGSGLRWPAMLVAMSLVMSVLYRFAPAHTHPRWRWVTPGGVLASLLWGAMSAAFSFYVGHWGHYDRTYGSLGALAGFMTWIWLSLIVVLLGAELNCELGRAEPKDAPSAA
jgi:membrane protein